MMNHFYKKFLSARKRQLAVLFFLKFIYIEKVTNFEDIFQFLLVLAFSENQNFKAFQQYSLCDRRGRFCKQEAKQSWEGIQYTMGQL